MPFSKKPCYFKPYIRSSDISAIEPYTHTSSPVECKNRISTNFSLNWFSSITKIPSPIIVATSIVQIPFPTQKLILSKSFAVITHTHTYTRFVQGITYSCCSRLFDNSRRQLANISKLPLVNRRDADLPIFTLQLDTSSSLPNPLPLRKISATQACLLPFSSMETHAARSKGDCSSR